MTMSPNARYGLAPRWAGLVTGAVAFLTISATVLAAPDTKVADPVLAKVNGVEIHQSDLDVAEQAAGQLPPMDESAKRDYLVQFMTDMILVSKVAEDKKLDRTNEFKKRLEFDRRRLLMELLLMSVGKDALGDTAAMHQVYEDAVKHRGPEEEVHARHILIRTTAGDEKGSKAAEDKIKAIILRLNKGEDFAKVASETTEDSAGKSVGGDLGYFTKEQMVPEFSEAAFKLDKGQISGPVKTQFGWHVIKVEDKRVKPAPKFEDVKPQIEQYVTRKAQAELVAKLRAAAKIEKMYKTEPPPAADKPKAPAELGDKPSDSGEKN